MSCIFCSPERLRMYVAIWTRKKVSLISLTYKNFLNLIWPPPRLTS
jgi:hypothetical protein